MTNKYTRVNLLRTKEQKHMVGNFGLCSATGWGLCLHAHMQLTSLKLYKTHLKYFRHTLDTHRMLADSYKHFTVI